MAGVSWMEGIHSGCGPCALVPLWAPAAVCHVVRYGVLSVSISHESGRREDQRRAAADMRPSTIKRNYYETSGRVVKYYDNIRFVYEIESRVREFKR